MNGALAYHVAVEAPRSFRALHMGQERIESLAVGRLRWVLGRARRTPFYRSILADAPPDDGSWNPREVLERLPLVDKETLLAAGGDLFEHGRARPQWFSSRSSGSTGEPFRVYYDARAWAILKLCTKARARWACGVRPWHRIAILDAFTRDPGEARTGRRVRRINVVEKDAGAIAAELAAFRPDAVYGLPSVLVETADVATDAIRPRVIFTSGELLTDGARARLERAYGCPVLDVYGSSETKEIAWECRAGSLHVNRDVVHVEVIDDDGRALPTGHDGRIVATVLVNAAMPLLRYVTGDRGATIPEGCRCGVALPRLGLLTGRESDYLELGRGRRVSPYHLTCALERVAGIRRFQVVQQAPTHLLVRVAPLASADRGSLGARIREAMTRVASVPLKVSVDLDASFDPGAGGKFRVVQALRSD